MSAAAAAESRAKSPDISTAAGLPIGTTLSKRGVHRRRQRQRQQRGEIAAAASTAAGGASRTATTAAAVTNTSAAATSTAPPPPTDGSPNSFGYAPRPGSPPPCRDALRFVQSLGLSNGGVVVPRRDLQNGLLAAELLAKLRPELGVRLASFSSGHGEPAKADNWQRVGALARAAGLAALADAALAMRVAAGERGAATELLERVYEEATGRSIQRPPPPAAAAGAAGSMATAAGKAQAMLLSVAAGGGAAAGEGHDDGGAAGETADGGGGPRPIRAPSSASGTVVPTFDAPRVAPAGDAAAVWRRFRG